MYSEDLTGLGRLHIPDERDRNFRMAAPPSERYYRNWLVPGPVDDQGATPQCVAYSVVHWLRAHPTVNAHREEYEVDQETLYRRAQRVDQWPGENYDGTSVRAGFAILREMGLVDSYTWAWDTATIARHILEIGPVVVGTDWTMDMFTPDREGYIRPTGPSAGGHAYLLTGVHLRKKTPWGHTGIFYDQNSWGPRWGIGGRSRISMQDFAGLLENHGEACTAVERRVR